jgi:hypothetical protein
VNRKNSNLFVLSVEGPGFMDRGNWSTHVIVGTFNTYDDAVDFFKTQPEDDRTDEDIWLLTDMQTQRTNRLGA